MIRELTHNEEILVLSEETEIQHINYLNEFKEKVYPIYRQAGFTLAEAFLAWKLNSVNSNICELSDWIREQDERI